MRNFRYTMLVPVLALLFPIIASAQGIESNPRLPGTALFVENRGQWESTARYLFRAPNLDLWITDRGMVYDIRGEKGDSGQAVALSFTGADGVRPTGIGRTEGTFSYFRGSDPRRWVAGAPGYERLKFREIYDGVDVLFYVEDGNPRYDIVVRPGADPGAVTMRVDGADRVTEEGGGTLKIVTRHGNISHAGLFAYQESDSGREPVFCRFQVDAHGEVGFVVGEYDRSRALIVDPLIFSAVVSGDSYVSGIAVGPDNSSYVTGMTYSAVFPLAPGAYKYDTVLDGYSDAFVARLKTDGSGLVYATYLGGTKQDWGYGIAVDAEGNAYISGSAESDDYPVTGGAFSVMSKAGSQDAFVTKLNPTGTELIYSTYLGGSQTEWGGGIAIDKAGNAYVAGSSWSEDFPTTPGAFDEALNGEGDAFVVKLNAAGSRLLYSTLIGGSGDDGANAIALDGQGRAHITGGTSPKEGLAFPTTNGAFDVTPNGDQDAFVTVVDPSGKGLTFSTLLGGAGRDAGAGIAVDSSGNTYVTGLALSTDFPTTPGAYDENTNGQYDCFVAKLGADGSKLDYSTLIGGARDDYGSAIAVDPFGNAYIAGVTYSAGFPLTSDALGGAQSDSTAAIIFKLDPTGKNLRHSTRYGGKSPDAGSALALDGNGALYVGGSTQSTDFPTTPGAFKGSTVGGSFVLKMNLPGSSAVLLEYPLGREDFCVGTTQEVRWRSLGVGWVKIELSSDGGRSYPTVLVESTPAGSGTWSWVIPNDLPPLSTYRIRISDVKGGDVVDESLQNFTIQTLPTIVSQSPGVNTFCVGEQLVLTASTVGPGHSYVWRRNGVRLTGQNDSVLRISTARLSDSGRYDAIVSGMCGAADTSAPMRVVMVPTTTAALDRTSLGVCAGGTIRVRAVGAGGNPTYVWRHGGVIVPGAVTALLELPARDASDTGDYDVIVTGLCGPPDTSAAVHVRLMKEPAIVSGLPARQIARPGSKVVFTISVTGDSLTFRWMRNGKDIPGAVRNTLEFDRVAIEDSGDYVVVVKGPCGIVTSDISRLDVEGEVVPTAVPEGRERAIAGSGRAVSIPHPARGTTRIPVELPAGMIPGAETRLHLFDTEGRLAADLSESFSRHDYREALLEADALPSGVYTCRLRLHGVEIPLGAIVVVR